MTPWAPGDVWRRPGRLGRSTSSSVGMSIIGQKPAALARLDSPGFSAAAHRVSVYRDGASSARLRPAAAASPCRTRRAGAHGAPGAWGLETNADLLQFSRGASSTPPFGSPFPQFTASLRLGYFGRRVKTAANRRLFAERRLCCSESAFAASGRRGPLLAESGGGAEARTSWPASAAVGPAPASAPAGAGPCGAMCATAVIWPTISQTKTA